MLDSGVMLKLLIFFQNNLLIFNDLLCRRPCCHEPLKLLFHKAQLFLQSKNNKKWPNKHTQWQLIKKNASIYYVALTFRSYIKMFLMCHLCTTSLISHLLLTMNPRTLRAALQMDIWLVIDCQVKCHLISPHQKERITLHQSKCH